MSDTRALREEIAVTWKVIMKRLCISSSVTAAAIA